MAIGPYWLQYLQARNMYELRLYRADLCISVWFNRNGVADEEITLKVAVATDACASPHVASGDRH